MCEQLTGSQDVSQQLHDNTGGIDRQTYAWC